VCNGQGTCVFNNVGLGQACNVQANNCSVGSCVAGSCACSGTNPNACGGTRCVNFQTDSTNCGACGVTCPMGCSAGRCICPAGQSFSGGSCRLNDGQVCTPNGGTPCINGCTPWFTDRDGDGFGDSNTAAVNRCGATPPGTPAGGGTFVREGGDCCDIAGNEDAANAHPGQTARFFLPALPAQCARSTASDHDYNCNGRNDGIPIIDCRARSQANCAIGNSTSGNQPGDIVPSPQVDIQVDPITHPDGSVVCGISAGPGTCAFFTDDNPSPFGLTGCAPDTVGFTGLSCN
jgi:hypothetical protein